ncbi:MAG TPA: bifunctional (p)ppGpp synthetase/guanosine-3',5'-bis(diphosphate) 3'-pyrophosphohydrolase [Candidatus Nanopelagicales bacterium]|nr:bifunctional (p)ppGpp synthetase/guanosine-3',5'-bis(diphosphate) 3'-pyrophosphohydrolase [Candidatus Nanopelagicales bacterium]
MAKNTPVATDAVPVKPPGPLEPSRRRSRFARLAGPRYAHPELEPVLRTLRRYHPKSDARLVERAYEMAEYLHRDQQRRSGEPYITHPLAVTEILAELGMPAPSLAAALLHDTVEDCGYSLDALREDFDDEVALLVDGVTKLDKVTYGEASAAETVRKMVVAMARDIRVLVIKLADRLHNMRTLQWLPEEKQQYKAKETLEIYAPLAHRLGMNAIKWELEDLSFATMYPKMYEEIVRLVGERAPSRDKYLAEVIADIDSQLKANKIKASVTGRPKHYYSVYQKMIVRGRDFNDIYDLVGVRILVDSVRDCYAVLGTIHAQWSPVPGRFKDFIAMPKFNMYQSLHTTVIGPDGKVVEVQIRTNEMHQSAELGVAAHWRYKQSDVGGKSGPDDFAWLRQLLDWQRETSDPGEFLDSLRYDLGSSEVYVFTPKGDVMALPSGATAVDFAYAVHTEVGHRCVGARVNGKLVPLESHLASGDVVEIFTSKAEGAGPSRDWLGFIASPRAKTKIKAWFSKERREESIESGKDHLARAMRKRGLPLQRLMTNQALGSIAVDLNQADVTALYASIGEGRISAETIVHRLVEAAGGVDGAADDAAEAITPRPGRRTSESRDVGVVVRGVDDLWVKLARCCTPVPGDPIMGFVTRGSGVSVHRDDCVNVPNLRQHPEREVPVEWAPTPSSVFLVNIQVEALDRSRLLADVTKALSDTHVNILSASVATTRDRIATSRFTFEMADPKHLGSALKAVRTVEGVYDAYRV